MEQTTLNKTTKNSLNWCPKKHKSVVVSSTGNKLLRLFE